MMSTSLRAGLILVFWTCAAAQEDDSARDSAAEALLERSGLVSLLQRIESLKELAPPQDRFEREMLENPATHAHAPASACTLKTLYVSILQGDVADAAAAVVEESRRGGRALPDTWRAEARRKCDAAVQELLTSAMKSFDLAFQGARKAAIEEQLTTLGGATRPGSSEVESVAGGADATGVLSRLRKALVRDRVLLDEVDSQVDDIANRSLAEGLQELRAQTSYVATDDPAGVEEREIAVALGERLKSFCAGRPYDAPFPSVLSRCIPSRAAELTRSRFLGALPGLMVVGAERVEEIVRRDLPQHTNPDRSLVTVYAALGAELRQKAIDKYASHVVEERRADFATYLGGIVDGPGADAWKTAAVDATRPVLASVRANIYAEQERAAFRGLVDGTWEPEEPRVVEAMQGAMARSHFEQVATWPGVYCHPESAPVGSLMDETRDWVVDAVGKQVARAAGDLGSQLRAVEALRPVFHRHVEAALQSGRADARDTAVTECTRLMEEEWTRIRGVSRRGVYEYTRVHVREVVAKYFESNSPAPSGATEVQPIHEPIRRTDGIEGVSEESPAAGREGASSKEGMGPGPGGGGTGAGAGNGGSEGDDSEGKGKGGSGGNCACGPNCRCGDGGRSGCGGGMQMASGDGTGGEGAGAGGETTMAAPAGATTVLSPAWWFVLLVVLVAVVGTALLVRFGLSPPVCPICRRTAGVA